MNEKIERYTLSYYQMVKTPILRRRKWWNIFGRDTLEIRDDWEMKTFYGLSNKAIITELRKDKTVHSDLNHLLFAGKTIWNPQLEVGSRTSEYVRTTVPYQGKDPSGGNGAVKVGVEE